MASCLPIIVLAALLAMPAAADPLPPATRAALTRLSVPEAGVSIVVREVEGGATLLELNPGISRAPASTMKLLPTWAALDLLGPAYAWKTRALADAPIVKGVLKGNLYLQGGGDPLLTIERWWRFVNDLRQSGLRAIEGDSGGSPWLMRCMLPWPMPPCMPWCWPCWAPGPVPLPILPPIGWA